MRVKEKAIELLAPAGSFESVRAAVQAGADAVYIGGSFFGARAYADNPDKEQLREAIDYVHLHGRKIYLTINTLFKEHELEQELFAYLSPLYEHGIDAVIVQDLGVLHYIRRQFPGLAVHASTQMTITDISGVRLVEESGASRAVLARELSLEEVASICRNTSVHIECFVHGAICYCYSGQCLYSSMVGGRSGNRGRCAQPCRLPWNLDGQEGYFLSPKDMCTLELLPDFIEAGIFSFKIEGRMKRPEYTAGVTRIYRKYIDLYLAGGRAAYKIDEMDQIELLDLYNRGGFTDGYYRRHNGSNIIEQKRPGHSGVAVGRIKKVEKGVLTAVCSIPVAPGDILEIWSPKKKRTYEFTAAADSCHGKTVTLKTRDAFLFQKNTDVRRMKNQRLLDELADQYVKGNIQEKIKGKLRLVKGFCATLEVTYREHEVCLEGAVVQPAVNQPLTEEKVRAAIYKTGNTPFKFADLELDMDADIFLPVKELAELKRNVLAAVIEKIVIKNRREPVADKSGGTGLVLSDRTAEKPVIHVSLDRPEQTSAVCVIEEVAAVYLEIDWDKDGRISSEMQAAARRVQASGKRCYLLFPYIFRRATRRRFETAAAQWLNLEADGIVVRNLESYMFLQDFKYTKEIILDYNVYTFNREARIFWRERGIAHDTIPLELNHHEAAARGCTGSELVVYGAVPLMITAGCIYQTAGHCIREEQDAVIKDRKQKSFRVRNCCSYCYNLLYNSDVLNLLDQHTLIQKLNPGSLRLIFTTEKEQDISRVIHQFIDVFHYNKPAEKQSGAFTRGHFQRGIE